MSLITLAIVYYIFGITDASRHVGHSQSDPCFYYKGNQPIQRTPIEKYLLRDLKDSYRDKFDYITNVPLNKFDNCKHLINKRDQIKEDALDSFNMGSWWNSFRNGGRNQVKHKKPVNNSVKRVCFDEMLNAQIYNRSYLAPLHFKPTISETFGNFDLNNPPWPNFKQLGVKEDNSAKRGTDIVLRAIPDSSECVMETNSQLRTTPDYIISASTESNTFNDSSFSAKSEVNLIKQDKRKKLENKPETVHQRMIFSFKDKQRTGLSSNPKQGISIGNFLVEVADCATSDALESTSKKVHSKNNIPTTNVNVKNNQPTENDTRRSAADKSREETKARKSRSLFQNPMNSRKFHLMHGLYSENNKLMEDALRQAEIQTLNVAAELLRSSRMKQSNLNKFSGPNLSNNQDQLLLPEISKELLQNKDSNSGFQLNNLMKKRTNPNSEIPYGLLHSQLEDRMKFLNDLSTEIERRKEELEMLERSYKIEHNNIIGIEKVGFKRNLENKKLHIRDCNFSQNIDDETLLESARDDLLKTIPEALLNLTPSNFSSNAVSNPLLEYLVSSYVNNYLQSLSEQQISSKPSVRNKRTLSSNICDRPFYFIKTPHNQDELEKALEKIEGIKNSLIKYKDNFSHSQQKRFTKRWLFSGQSPSAEYHSLSARELGNASQSAPHDSGIENLVKPEITQLPLEINLKNKNKNCSNPLICDYHRKFSILESDLMDLKNSVANIHSGGETHKDKDTNNIEVQVFVSVDLFNSSTVPTSLECRKKSGSQELPKPIIGTSVAVKELNSTETLKKAKTQDPDKFDGERCKRYDYNKLEDKFDGIKWNMQGLTIKRCQNSAKTYSPSFENESDLCKLNSQYYLRDQYLIKPNISNNNQLNNYKINNSELKNDKLNDFDWSRNNKTNNDYQIFENILDNHEKQINMHTYGSFATDSTHYERDFLKNGIIKDRQCLGSIIINKNLIDFNHGTSLKRYIDEKSSSLTKSKEQKPNKTFYNDKSINFEYFKDFSNINMNSNRSTEDVASPEHIFRSSKNSLRMSRLEPNSRKKFDDYLDVFNSLNMDVGFKSDNSYDFLENDFKPKFNFNGGKENVKLNSTQNFFNCRNQSYNYSCNNDRNHYRRDAHLEKKSNVLTDIIIPLQFVHFSDRIENSDSTGEGRKLKTENMQSNNELNVNSTYDRSDFQNNSLNPSLNNSSFSNTGELLNRNMRSKGCINQNYQVLKQGRKGKLADENLKGSDFDVVINKKNVTHGRTYNKPKVSFSNFLFHKVKQIALRSENHDDALKTPIAKESRNFDPKPIEINLGAYKKPIQYRNGISSQQEKPEIKEHSTSSNDLLFTPEKLEKGWTIPVRNYSKYNNDDDYPQNILLNKYPRRYGGINFMDDKGDTEIVILNYNNYDDTSLLPEKSSVICIKNPKYPQRIMNSSLRSKSPQRIIWVKPFGGYSPFNWAYNPIKRPDDFMKNYKSRPIMCPERKIDNLRNIWRKQCRKRPIWNYNIRQTTPEPISAIDKYEDLYEYIYNDLNSDEMETAFSKYSKNILFDYDSNPTTSPLIKISKSTRMTFVPSCTDDMLEIAPCISFPDRSTQIQTIDTSPKVKNRIFQVFMNETPPTLVTIPTEIFKNVTFSLSTTCSTGVKTKITSSINRTSSPNKHRSGKTFRTTKTHLTTTSHVFLTKTTPHRKTFRRCTTRKARISTSTERTTTMLRATIHHPHRQRLHRKDPSMKKYRYNITKPPYALRKGPTSPQPWTDTIFFEKFSVKIGFRDSTETSIAPLTIHHRHGLASFFCHRKKHTL